MVDEIKPVMKEATEVKFEVELEACDTEVKSWLNDKDGTSRRALLIHTK